jgi:hypothetical protein
MELINTNTKDKNGNGNQELETGNKNHSDQIAKVTITTKAESLMRELVAKVNDGFEFGRLNRHQLMSWILTKFADEHSDAEIRAIRSDHFDEIALLELSLKQFKQVGSLPPELKKLLLANAGLDDSGKRPSKKPLTHKSTSDGLPV